MSAEHTPTPYEAVCWLKEWRLISRAETFDFDGRTNPQHICVPCKNYGVNTSEVRKGREKDNMERLAAVSNAFHSPTRTIATEQITEGLFWQMYDLLQRLSPHLEAITCYASTTAEHEPNKIVKDVRALLSSLKIEEDQ